MSVQSEIDRIITAVGNAYSKVSEKGGTVPASQTVANLATAIDSIPAGGGAPSLQSKALTITSNGTVSATPDAPYDALKKVDVTVDVASGGGVENETCFIEIQGYIPNGGFIAYTGPNIHAPFANPFLEYFTEGFDLENLSPLRILKNSSLFIGGITGDCVTEGSIVAGTTSQDGNYSFWVTGDCKIYF